MPKDLILYALFGGHLYLMLTKAEYAKISQSRKRIIQRNTATLTSRSTYKPMFN